jgi:hypothetical protein
MFWGLDLIDMSSLIILGGRGVDIVVGEWRIVGILLIVPVDTLISVLAYLGLPYIERVASAVGLVLFVGVDFFCFPRPVIF